MILSFSRLFPWNMSTNFEYKIKSGSKLHTLRIGDRWTPGNLIHFWNENPRNPGKNPSSFYNLNPYDFNHVFDVWKDDPSKEDPTRKTPVLIATEDFTMIFEDVRKGDDDFKDGMHDQYRFQMKVGELSFNETLIDLIAMQDGFDQTSDFFEFFNQTRKRLKQNILKGQVLHWKKSSIYDSANANSIIKI